jgi:hypothetical protein
MINLFSQLTLLILLLSSVEDPSANVEDVSFVTITHGFDTTRDGIITLDDGSRYQIIPNGEERGLARLEVIPNVL